MSVLSTILSATGIKDYVYGAIIAVIIGGFSWYTIHERNIGKAEVAQVEQKAAKTLQTTETKTNTQVVTKYVTQTKVIHDVQTKIQTQIVTLHDNEFLSDGWVRLHNSAATDLPSSPSSTDGTSSTITVDQALTTVTNNYATCQANAKELSDLQAWMTQTQKNITKVNK